MIIMQYNIYYYYSLLTKALMFLKGYLPSYIAMVSELSSESGSFFHLLNS